MQMLPAAIFILGGALTLALGIFAFSGPSVEKAKARRLIAVRDRHSNSTVANVEAHMRRIQAAQASRMDGVATTLLPNSAAFKKRIAMTGKSWTPGQYLMGSAVIFVLAALLIYVKTGGAFFALFGGLALGLFIPHTLIKRLIKKRIIQFNKKFPDALELLVRGLRSGLPISETIGVVGSEVPGPVGVEFRGVSDKIKIGRTMDAALQEAADRLGTPEFQFFCITLQIQRETGGNLAETLSNLATVLRGRAMIKLKIKAMSSESKASAYIIGCLPFVVFALLYVLNPEYMLKFFTDQTLMVVGIGGVIWMAIGAFIMSKMISFEI